MAGIYNADIFCDGCIEEIKDEICNELWEDKRRDAGAECPDCAILLDFDSREELSDYLKGMDERYYDSDEYPKGCSGSDESDCPEHCGECGVFLENDLTSEGADYVRNAVRDDLMSGCDDSVAITEWFPYYSWLDWGDVGSCDDCGALAVLAGDYDSDERCADCLAECEKCGLTCCDCCTDCGEHPCECDEPGIDPCLGCPALNNCAGCEFGAE